MRASEDEFVLKSTLYSPLIFLPITLFYISVKWFCCLGTIYKSKGERVARSSQLVVDHFNAEMTKKQNGWPPLQFWPKLSCRFKNTNTSTYHLFLRVLARRTAEWKKSLGTICAQQRYSQSQRIHMAQIHQFKCPPQRESTLSSHISN